jgi:hypothetical protein
MRFDEKKFEEKKFLAASPIQRVILREWILTGRSLPEDEEEARDDLAEAEILRLQGFKNSEHRELQKWGDLFYA